MLALIGTGGVQALQPFSREIFLLEVTVAGTSFCQKIDELEPLLVADKALKMFRDPDNKHDDQAIGIYLDQTRIGWVPRDENEILSRLMDAGKAFFCRIKYCTRKNSWVKVKVRIFMVE